MLSTSPPKKCFYNQGNIYPVVGVDVSPLYGTNAGSIATFYDGAPDGYAYKQYPDFYMAGKLLPNIAAYKYIPVYKRQIIEEMKPMY